ncbi:DUF2878 domain-containing protein [Legionella israelensis]|uniref:DUF2878 domain-containing protein n=1 Tax=Legionella israelensis TaxID=454 RepID=A0A0W0VJF2_9GAMM|nr:DUF2878 domain-containing protein [Legionella israelensis]KTD20229.1 hypothetical protein Lisr_1813 [Legionella israelensis]QBS09015.1 DUF2878 domain-containing protein [Legionella israelensis]SCY39800.1 Protein of unknown function [Legionella israelensis DSM 19235]STX58721.1 Protein of uncharacterised function (DUF2878) [Legionella israelensis]
MNNKISWAIHFFAYYIAWIGCIILAGLDYEYLSAVLVLVILFFQIAWQIIHGFLWKAPIYYTLFLTFLGIITDTLWLQMHLIDFNANPFSFHFAPLWMMSLWLSFGFNLIVLYQAFLKRYVTVGISSLVLIPVAYWLGIELGAASILKEGRFFYLILGVTWAILLPFSLYVFLQIKDIQ